MSSTVSQLGLDPTLASSSLDDRARLKKACEKFEGMFLSYMLKVMRETVPDSGLLGKGFGKEIFESLFDQALGEKMAEHQDFGLARVLYKQLSRTLGDSPQQSETHSGVRPLDLLKDFAPARTGAPAPTRPGHSPTPAPKRIENLDDIVVEAARQTKLDPELIFAVIETESAGNASAVSPKGALGLMQLMPDTAREVGVLDPLNPFENVLGGARYLSRMLQRFGGDLELALAAYNAGPTAVEKHGGVPPYRETREYVQKVTRLYRARRELAANAGAAAKQI